MKSYRLTLLVLLLSLCSFAEGQDTLRWEKKATLPGVPRIDFGSFVIDSNFYVVGGADSIGDWLKDVWKYNIPTDTWQQLYDFPFGPILEQTGFTLNGKGYICTGLDSVSFWDCDTLMWEYDPSLDSWTPRASFPGSYREKASSFTYHNKAYVGLGYACGHSATDLWEYDPITNTWSQRDSLPTIGRAENGLTIVDSIAYITGGMDTNNVHYNETWSYNILTNQWRQLSNMPGGTKRYVFTLSFDSFFLAGLGDLYFFQFAHDLYRYDIPHDRWDTVINLNFVDSSNLGGSSFVLGKQAYFFGGSTTDTTFYRNMWTADASALFHDSTLASVPAMAQEEYRFKLFPNLIQANGTFSVQSSEEGLIEFYNELGQPVHSAKLIAGTTHFTRDDLKCAPGVILYKATMKSGRVENGRVVVVR